MHLGGLMPIALGLFHRSDAVKNAVIDLLDRLQSTMVSLPMRCGRCWLLMINDDRDNRLEGS